MTTFNKREPSIGFRFLLLGRTTNRTVPILPGCWGTRFRFTVWSVYPFSAVRPPFVLRRWG